MVPKVTQVSLALSDIRSGRLYTQHGLNGHNKANDAKYNVKIHSIVFDLFFKRQVMENYIVSGNISR
jgi:hypothetical protein